MWKIIREREQGQHQAGSSFRDVLYRDSLPILRRAGNLEMHTGCVNHISFSENGGCLDYSTSVIGCS